MTQRYLLALSCLLCVSTIADAQTVTRNDDAVLYYTGFENGTLVEPNYPNFHPTNPNADRDYTAFKMFIDRMNAIDPGRPGNEDYLDGYYDSTNFRVLVGDFFPRSGENCVVSHVPRTESASRSELAETRHAEILPIDGLERWIALSICVPDNWQATTTTTHALRWLGNGHSLHRRGPMELTTRNGLFHISHSWNDTVPASKQEGNLAQSENRTDAELVPVIPGQWNDFVFHIKWNNNTGGDGFLEIWHNDISVYYYEGPIGYVYDTAPWVILGCNRMPWGNANFVDKVQTYNENGEPNGTTPLDPPVSGIAFLYDDYCVGDETARYQDVVPGTPRLPLTTAPKRNLAAIQFAHDWEDAGSFINYDFPYINPERPHRNLDYTAFTLSTWGEDGYGHNIVSSDDSSNDFIFGYNDGVTDFITAPYRQHRRKGNYAMRMYVPRNEAYPSNYRSEVVPKLYYELLPPEGLERWIGISVYVPEDFPDPAPRINSLNFQWHGGGNGGTNLHAHPCMSIRTDDGHFAIKHTWDDTIPETVQQGRDKSNANKIYTPLVPIERGTWNDFVLHFKWNPSQEGDGFLEIWHNDRSVYRYDGPLGYNSQREPVMQFGVYKPEWKNFDFLDQYNAYDENGTFLGRKTLDPQMSKLEFYYDELRFGYGDARYQDVVPGTPRLPLEEEVPVN